MKQTKQSVRKIDRIEHPLPIDLDPTTGECYPTFDEKVRDKINEIIDWINKYEDHKE